MIGAGCAQSYCSQGLTEVWHRGPAARDHPGNSGAVLSRPHSSFLFKTGPGGHSRPAALRMGSCEDSHKNSRRTEGPAAPTGCATPRPVSAKMLRPSTGLWGVGCRWALPRRLQRPWPAARSLESPGYGLAPHRRLSRHPPGRARALLSAGLWQESRGFQERGWRLLGPARESAGFVSLALPC